MEILYEIPGSTQKLIATNYGKDFIQFPFLWENNLKVFLNDLYFVSICEHCSKR